ncbi:hypothetical protein TraAM80_10260, partial [Trypanosoma rangeli]
VCVRGVAFVLRECAGLKHLPWQGKGGPPERTGAPSVDTLRPRNASLLSQWLASGPRGRAGTGHEAIASPPRSSTLRTCPIRNERAVCCDAPAFAATEPRGLHWVICQFEAHAG